MIDADKKRFRGVMMALAAEKRYQDNLDEALLRIMFEGMKNDCTIEDVERLAPQLARACKFFPRLDEWLDAIEKLPPADTVAGLLPPSGETNQIGRPIYCLKCRDEGWTLTNDTNPASVVKCSCRETNPALGAGQRKKRRSDS